MGLREVARQGSNRTGTGVGGRELRFVSNPLAPDDDPAPLRMTLVEFLLPYIDCAGRMTVREMITLLATWLPPEDVPSVKTLTQLLRNAHGVYRWPQRSGRAISGRVTWYSVNPWWLPFRTPWDV